ncbi:MAG TPA: MASE1 domain-containing protein [Thermoanaerobaculia bacterium]|nr:MASE1 domain-containing protein [Thermoanaerobaculia bacterium]
MSELAREVGAADISKDRGRIQYILLTAAVAAIYFVAGKLGLQLAIVHASATAVWPPTGIALAAALVFGSRVAPGVFLGAFLTNATTAVPLGAALGIAGGNTIEALVGAFLVNRYAGGRRAFDHPPNVFRFVALGALAATTTSATIGVLTLCLSGSAPWHAFGSVWLTWWFGDAMGALLFTPFLLAWNAGERVVWTRAKVLEAAAVLGLLLLAAALMSGFLLRSSLGNAPLGFATIPFLLWIAFRFSPREAFSASFLLFAFNLAGILAGHGQFARSSPNASLILLQGFSGFATIMTLFVSAVVAERIRADRSLRELNRELEWRVEQRTTELLRSQQEIDRFFALSLDMLGIASTDGYFKRVSPVFQSTLGYTEEELLAIPFIERVHPDDVQATLLELSKLAAGTPTIYFENRLRTKAGDYKLIAWSCQPTPDGTLYAVGRDVGERRRGEQAIAESERRYREIFDRSLALVSTHAVDGTLLSINPAGAAALGYAPAELVGTSLLDLVPERLRARASIALQTLPKTETGEGLVTLRSRSGEERTFMYRHSWVAEADARSPYILAHAVDITERLRAEQVLEHQALHDPLTGCANRTLFFDHLHGAIARAQRARTRGDAPCIVGLLYIDLDGFKAVNDRFGHAAGDFILRETAARIRARIREEDTAARLGGDEFCIVADKLHGAEDARKLAESLLAAIQEPLVWEGEEIRIGGSFGIALYPQHGELADVLLGRADQAMYAAKTEGRNRVRIAGGGAGP